jgi:hypothetical protein
MIAPKVLFLLPVSFFLIYNIPMQLSVDLKPGEKLISEIPYSLYAERAWAIYGLPFGTIFLIAGIIHPNPYLEVASFVLLVVLWSWGLYRWMLWYFTLYLLTSERLITVDQLGIFKKEVKELQVDRILDITYEQKGMVENMAHYGVLHVIGIGLTIDLYDVKHPGKTRDMILDARPKGSKLTTKEVVNLLKNNNS